MDRLSRLELLMRYAILEKRGYTLNDQQLSIQKTYERRVCRDMQAYDLDIQKYMGEKAMVKNFTLLNKITRRKLL